MKKRTAFWVALSWIEEQAAIMGTTITYIYRKEAMYSGTLWEQLNHAPLKRATNSTLCRRSGIPSSEELNWDIAAYVNTSA
jgi:hypothetical protein